VSYHCQKALNLKSLKSIPVFTEEQGLAGLVLTYRKRSLLCSQWQNPEETKQNGVPRLTKLHPNLHNSFMQIQEVMTETDRVWNCMMRRRHQVPEHGITNRLVMGKSEPTLMTEPSKLDGPKL
jgi:hypothetical protein